MIAKQLIRIAVCDDEEPFRIMLANSIAKLYRERKIRTEISSFATGEELLALGVEACSFDVIFLDVEMGDEGGIATARMLRKLSEDVPIVFVTAIINSWNKGYEVGAFRYIIKDPRTFQALLTECVDALNEKFFSEEPIINIKFSDGWRQISAREMVYVESMGHMLSFHIMKDGQITEKVLRSRLTKFEEILSEHDFIRIHQSYMVNAKYIQKVNNYRVILCGMNIDLPVSKDRYRYVKTTLSTVRGAI